MSMTKAQAFKARMQERGLVQANEWVPSNQRALFRAIAKALREGLTVTIGEAEPVTSNHQSTCVTTEVQRIIDDYIDTSRANDPASKLKRAVDAVVKRDVLPQIDAEVRRRHMEESSQLKKQQERLTKMEKEVAAELERVRLLRQNLDGLMTEDEYKQVRACLHPDRAPQDRQPQFAKAFVVFTRLEQSVNRNMPVKLRRAHGWAD